MRIRIYPKKEPIRKNAENNFLNIQVRLRLRSKVALRGFFRFRREHLAPPKNHSRRGFVNFARQIVCFRVADAMFSAKTDNWSGKVTKPSATVIFRWGQMLSAESEKPAKFDFGLTGNLSGKVTKNLAGSSSSSLLKKLEKNRPGFW